MFRPSRRTVLQGTTALAVLPFAKWWPAKAQQPVTRHSAFSEEGKEALASYAKAVAEMRKLSQADPTDPLGWLYQYKMHQFPDNALDILFDETIPEDQRWPRVLQAKDAELTKYFGPADAGNTKREQAEATWGVCPHSGGTAFAENFFPWHRMYLLFFERIVRKLSGDGSFALPYWGYMDGPASQVIPAAFIASGDNPLSHERAAAINSGGQMDADDFKGGFWDQRRAFDGFSLEVEREPHNPVHITVGELNDEDLPNFDMADPFRSPRDPVFWLHHAEIDRIWESGRKNAQLPDRDGDWLATKHHFFDEDRNFVELTNADVLNMEQIKDWPGYTYKKLLEPPAPKVPEIVMAQAFERTQQQQRVLATGADVSLKSGLQTNALEPTSQAESFAERPGGAPGRITLEVSSITLNKRSAANVGLYLNAPAGATDEQLKEHLVGTVSTFFLLPKGVQMDHGGKDHGGKPPTYVFDVTELVGRLRQKGLWTGKFELTSKETTGSLGGAAINLGDVQVVETTAGPPRQ